MKKIITLLCVFGLFSFSGCKKTYVEEPIDEKPVIYLYPQEEMNVSVSLEINGQLTTVYPMHDLSDNKAGWNVTAMPDGTLIDKDGKEYNYLYWEGLSNVEWDFSEGFCVKGEDTATFLEEKLIELGLNRKEANEFIVYWLARMENNPYNLISFQTDVYEKNAVLTVVPSADTTIRVFMAYKPIEKSIEIMPQEIDIPSRKGFTVVEWGGIELK